MTNSGTLSVLDGLFVARLLTEEPALGVAIKWAKQLNAMLRHRVSENLDELLHAAGGILLANFAAGLRRDFDAVKAALKLPWTTSPVEGQNSRLKMLKRTMSGRAASNSFAPACSMPHDTHTPSTESAGEPKIR